MDVEDDILSTVKVILTAVLAIAGLYAVTSGCYCRRHRILVSMMYVDCPV